MRKLISSALLATLLAVAIAPAHSEETTLVFTTANNPNTRMNKEFMRPWAERINEQGQGVLKIDIREGTQIVNIFNAYDRILADVAQISFLLHNYASGKFKLSPVAALPWPESAEDRSVALWRLYKSGALDTEYDESIPLVIFGASQSQLHMAKPISSLDDWKGVKVITPTKVNSDAAKLFGATPLSLGSPEMYEAIQRGTTAGTIVGWTAFDGFKLAEVTKFHIDQPMGTASGMIFMSRKRYNALPAAARKILDDNSGEAPSRLFGAWWDHENARARDAVKASPDQTVVEPSPEQAVRWNQKIAPVIDEWADSVPDGQKVLASYRAILAKVVAGQ